MDTYVSTPTQKDGYDDINPSTVVSWLLVVVVVAICVIFIYMAILSLWKCPHVLVFIGMGIFVAGFCTMMVFGILRNLQPSGSIPFSIRKDNQPNVAAKLITTIFAVSVLMPFVLFVLAALYLCFKRCCCFVPYHVTPAFSSSDGGYNKPVSVNKAFSSEKNMYMEEAVSSSDDDDIRPLTPYPPSTDIRFIEKGKGNEKDQKLKEFQPTRREKSKRSIRACFCVFSEDNDGVQTDEYSYSSEISLRMEDGKGNKFVKRVPGTESIANLEKLVEIATSIGVIVCGDVVFGTGFVVGGVFVMTALHVVKTMLDLRGCSKTGLQRQIEIEMQKRDSKISFNYTREIMKNAVFFNFKKQVAYIDTTCDVIVLPLEGTVFPPSFTQFGDLKPKDTFDFIGHPNGKHKQRDISCNVITVSRKDVNILSKKLCRDYPQHCSIVDDPYFGIGNKHQYIFHCAFEHNGSGSPGMMFNAHGEPIVCTILTGGYPNFCWDLKSQDKTLKDKYRYEYGSKMSAVYLKMKKVDPMLCDTIFRKHPWNN